MNWFNLFMLIHRNNWSVWVFLIKGRKVLHVQECVTNLLREKEGRVLTVVKRCGYFQKLVNSPKNKNIENVALFVLVCISGIYTFSII